MAWRVVGAGIFGLGLVAGALAAPTRSEPPPGSGPEQEPANPEVLGAVLGGMRGADPVACELALVALEGRSYGRSGIRADVEGIAPAGVAAGELLAWVGSPPRDDPRLVPPLAEALSGPDPCVARSAARLLGRLGTDPAVAALRAGARAADAATRRNAVIGLGLAERPETGPDLHARLSDDDASVRASAAWALGEMEDRAAVPALIRALGQDADATARRAAAWALGRIE